MKLKDFDFRIWDNIEKKYIKTSEGLYIENTEHNDASNCNRIIENYDHAGFSVDHPYNWKNEEYFNNENAFSIELFTGYFDKNGNKIYEGDILKYEDLEELYHITRDDTYKMSKIEIFSKNFVGEIYKRKAEPDISFLKVFKSEKNVEVIGNIHEDGDLLKEIK
ncbi:putative YopX-like protein [Campylobacter phage F379]|uniref:Putative YopX-like protein n=1 Tax=Campylobacter phage F379 TaxID=2776767 RepID=A0A7L8ZJJ3_9CAUD|nr:putative YopX-like protein [Campylobacter phage F379]